MPRAAKGGGMQEAARAVRRLQAVYADILAGHGQPEDATQAYEEAQQALQAVRPEVEALLSEGLSALSQRSNASFELEVQARRDELVEAETRRGQALGLKRREVERAVRDALHAGLQNSLKTVQSVDDLLEALRRSHEHFLREVQALRHEPLPREVKKRRKRDLAQATLSTVSGAVLIAVNAAEQVLDVFAHAFGAGAIHEGLKALPAT